MSTSLRLIPLLESIRPQMERVERLLRETLAQVEEPLGSMLRHSLGGGKRLRPALVILSGQMLQGDRQIPASTAPFHSLAAAVEMLHTATLIHDDLVDETLLRRGHETLHTIWPTGATVLAGDYLLAQAALLTARLEHPHILKVFAETGSLGFRRVKTRNSPRITRINTKNQKLVKIRVIRGKESSTC